MPNVGLVELRSTRFYLVNCPAGKLMFDAGWAGQMPALLGRLRAYGVAPAEIRYIMFSHNHTDHASLVQEVKRACGAALIIHEVQIPHLGELEEYHRRKGEPYVPIRVEKGDLVVSGPSPRIPAAVGLGGWIVPTPGHSPDHISLVLEDGKAFTGDLPRPELAGEGDAGLIEASWKRLTALGARTFYPSHGEPFASAA